MYHFPKIEIRVYPSNGFDLDFSICYSKHGKNDKVNVNVTLFVRLVHFLNLSKP